MADDPRRRADRHAATQDRSSRRPPTGTSLGGVSFQQGLLSRPGDRRAHPVPRAAEGAPVRVSRAPAAAAPGTRLFSAVFADQPCGTVVNAAPPGRRHATSWRWCSRRRRRPAGDGVRRSAPRPARGCDPLPLPYAVPGAASPPRRPKLVSEPDRPSTTTSGTASPATRARARRGRRAHRRCRAATGVPGRVQALRRPGDVDGDLRARARRGAFEQALAAGVAQPSGQRNAPTGRHVEPFIDRPLNAPACASRSSRWMRIRATRW